MAMVLVTGCSDVAGRFEDAQTRINAAMPPSIEVTALSAAAAAAAEAVPGRRARIEREMTAFLQGRVIECAKGVAPSWRDSAADVRSTLKDVTCFAVKDQQMLAWLRRMHVGTHLLRPAEPIESTSLVASVLLDQEISRVRLPERGSIALASHPQGWTLIDLRTGTKVREGKDADRWSARRPVLSRNGHVAVMAPEKGRLVVEETASGRLLEDLGAGGVSSVNWISDTMAILNSASQRKSLLVDYSTGREAELPIEGIDFYWGALTTPVPGEYLLNGQASLRLVRIDSTEAALSVTSLREVRLEGMLVYEDASALSSDGRTFLTKVGRMTVVNVASAEASALDTGLFLVTSALPHADPGKFFLTAVADDRRRPAGFVLDVPQRTLARLSEAGDGRARWQYWPAARKYVTTSGRALRVVDSPPPTETAEPLATLAARALQAENERKLAAVEQPGTVQRGAPPLLAVPAGSRVLAVGAYESRAGSHGVGRPRVAGAIDVTVMRTGYPVVLVLSSYEPVNWRIQLAPGAALSAVLLFGYHESSVVGQGGARIHRGGTLYAYNRQSSEFERLNREVAKLTGLDINHFQGVYAATNFSVGAW